MVENQVSTEITKRATFHTWFLHQNTFLAYADSDNEENEEQTVEEMLLKEERLRRKEEDDEFGMI